MTEIERYEKLGITCPILLTKSPSVCLYSISRKCLVNENGVHSLELVNNKLTPEHNRFVALQVHDNLNINQINTSNGIIISEFNHSQFRFGYIPTI